MDNLAGCIFNLSINENDNMESIEIKNDIDIVNKLENMSLYHHNDNIDMNIDVNPINIPLHNFNAQMEYATRFTSTGRHIKNIN